MSRKLCEHQNYIANMGVNTVQLYREEFNCPWCPSPAPERLGESRADKHLIWCEHLEYRGGGEWEYKGDSFRHGYTTNPGKFCADCGKERPAQKKRLAEILHNARHMANGMSQKDAEKNWSQHTDISQEKTWGGVSQAAISWFRELVQSIKTADHLRNPIVCVTAEEFKQSLLATLDREAEGGMK